MRFKRWLFLGAASAAAVVPAAAGAQEIPPGNPWSHGTTLSASVGVASASPGSGILAGVGIGWEVTPRFGVEGDTAWLDRPRESEAFAAALTAHFRPRGLQAFSPYLKGGIGLYRLSLGALDDAPSFYRPRAEARAASGATRATFTDPSVVAGGGINLFATRRLAFRPEVQATVVMRDSRTQVVTAVTLQVDYHFEDHSITPGRRSR